LADVANAVDGTQIYWLDVVFFVVATLAVLMLPKRHSVLWLTAAVVLAVGASLTALPGFLVWPVGLLWLVWRTPWTRRTLYECLSWSVAALLTTAVYLPGYRASGCVAAVPGQCSSMFVVQHPVTAFRYLLIMVGNVVPGGYWSQVLSKVPVRRFEVLGLVLLAAAIYVAVQSVRRRSKGEEIPLPLSMITFALLWDILIVIGRANSDLDSALNNNRFVLPNLFLLAAIFVYALGRVELLWQTGRQGRAKRTLFWCVGGMLIVLFVVQLSVATSFGHVNGSIQRNLAIDDARLVANLDRLSPQQQGCELGYVVGLGLWSSSGAEKTFAPFIHTARVDQLSLFQPAMYRAWRAKGLPPLKPQCRQLPPATRGSS